MEQDKGRRDDGNAKSSSVRLEDCGEDGERRAQAFPLFEKAATAAVESSPMAANSSCGYPRDEATCGDEGTASRSHPPAPSVEEVGAGGCPAYAFHIHAARAVDPLIGEMFVCPQTLEALCLHRMLGLPLSFTWEHIPSPSLSWRGGQPSTQSWWPLASTGPSLPAGVDPKTGMMLSGYLLLEALRSCAHSKVRAPVLDDATGPAEAHARVRGGTVAAESALEKCRRSSKDLACIGVCETRSPVEQATDLAVAELVQQAVDTALSFYMWKDDETFRSFTRPMLQNTFGCVYGTYYCWAVRRSIGGAEAACNSPRVFPEDLNRHFPDFEDSEAAHDSVTVEELLIVDGIRRALRAVEQHLQGKPFLGGCSSNALDATIFARLAILFSLPLPDRRELQKVLLNAGTLLQYCGRVQEAHQIWPSGPSFLFGVLSLAEVARGASLCVHSWRQQRGTSGHGNCEEETEGSNEGQARRFLWWLGAATCCAVILVAAGKTPFRLTEMRLPKGPLIPRVANNG